MSKGVSCCAVSLFLGSFVVGAAVFGLLAVIYLVLILAVLVA